MGLTVGLVHNKVTRGQTSELLPLHTKDLVDISCYDLWMEFDGFQQVLWMNLEATQDCPSKEDVDHPSKAFLL